MNLHRSYLLIIALLVTSHVGAQISLTASADAKQIVAGQYFTLTFTLENARGSNFQPPSFIDFDVVGGPSTSTQMTIINGRRQQKMSYSYSLTSSKIGKYEIGSASILASGKKYTSNSIDWWGRIHCRGGRRSGYWLCRPADYFEIRAIDQSRCAFLQFYFSS